MFGASRAAFTRTMRRGDSGDDVRRLQELLRAAGYDPGPVDGIFGSATQAAVVAFQRAERLSPDGFAGPLTIAALTRTGPPSTGTATGLSLHIGLNRVDGAAYPFPVPVLAGCLNDANDMQDLARGKGFRPRQLLDEAATSTAVLDSIERAAGQLSAGDIFLLTYSGHGSQVPDPAETGDRLSETWVLWDRQVVDDELYARWGLFRPGVRILVISDSCHSGTVSRALRLLNAELSRQTEEARTLTVQDRERVRAAVTRSREVVTRDLIALAQARDGAAPAVALAREAAPSLVRSLAEALAPILRTAGVSRPEAALDLADTVIGPLVGGGISTRALPGQQASVLDIPVLDTPRLLDESLAAADLLARADVYRDAVGPARRSAEPQSKILLLAACQDNQTASDGRPDPSGHQNGAFTSALRSSWESALSYRDLYEKIARQLPATQSPNLYWANAQPDLDFEGQPPFQI